MQTAGRRLLSRVAGDRIIVRAVGPLIRTQEHDTATMAAREIALVITDLNVGGAERCLVEVATRLDRGRFRPAVYCLDTRPPTGRDALVRRLDAADVETHFLAVRAWQLPRAVHRLRQLLRTQRAEVVQSFLFHANVVARLAARASGIRNVLSGVRVAEQAARWHLRVDRLTQMLVSRYTCVSQAVARFSRETGRLPAEKLVVIPNGVDTACYPARPADLATIGVPRGRQVVTFVGRLTPQKGLTWLLETCPTWMPQTPACDLLLVGAGPEEERLRRTAQHLGVADRVHFAGWRPDVPEILAASRLLVLPSRWEGMPNVVLEAMASRLPVLATDAEGVREALGDRAAPQISAYGNTGDWAAKLVELLRNRMLATQLAHDNRRRVEQQFSIFSAVTAYETLWTELLG